METFVIGRLQTFRQVHKQPEAIVDIHDNGQYQCNFCTGKEFVSAEKLVYLASASATYATQLNDTDYKCNHYSITNVNGNVMKKSTQIAISEAEAQVMEILWRAPGPLVAEQVVVALAESQRWQMATVKTLLNRLLNKGAIGAQKEGRRFLYHAVLRREDWLASESEGLLQRLFGGRLAPLIAHFGHQRKLSPDDIQELRKLIDEFGDDE